MNVSITLGTLKEPLNIWYLSIDGFFVFLQFFKYVAKSKSNSKILRSFSFLGVTVGQTWIQWQNKGWISTSPCWVSNSIDLFWVQARTLCWLFERFNHQNWKIWMVHAPKDLFVIRTLDMRWRNASTDGKVLCFYC